jgi:hypothetical protein
MESWTYLMFLMYLELEYKISLDNQRLFAMENESSCIDIHSGFTMFLQKRIFILDDSLFCFK